MNVIKKLLGSLTLHVRFSELSLLWKFLIVLNVALDVPVLLYAVTGYSWRCDFNYYPAIYFVLLLFSSLILILFSYQLNRKLLLGVGHIAHSAIIFLFSLLSVCMILFLVFGAFLSKAANWTDGIERSVPSPNGLRIAEVCRFACGDSCIDAYKLRVSNRFVPFIDLQIDDLEYDSPEFFVPEVKWLSNDVLQITEEQTTERTIRASLVYFDIVSFLLFCLYFYLKYSYVFNGLSSTQNDV